MTPAQIVLVEQSYAEVKPIADVAAKLPSTGFLPADLAEWRKGGEHAMRKTPHGYLGDPASADAERGRKDMETESAAIAAAIERTLKK